MPKDPGSLNTCQWTELAVEWQAEEDNEAEGLIQIALIIGPVITYL